MSDEINVSSEELEQAPRGEEQLDEQVQADSATEQPEADENPTQKGILGDLEEKKAKKSKKPKKVLTPEQKKKRTIKALIITGAVVLVIAIFFGSCAIATAVGTKALIKQAQSYTSVEYTEHKQLTPTYDSELGYYVFTKDSDRDFKVVQLTDVHIGGGSFSQKKDAWAMNAVATMIRREQPDLVVVTGDIAYPVPPQAGTFNNLNATKIFASMMEQLGVYWTFAFGNHDTELYSLYSRTDICEYYANAGFKYCLFRAGFCDEKDYIGDDARGFGNDMIVVKNADGSINQAIVTLDSHSYTDGDYFGAAWKYDNIHQCQVDWYVQEIEKLTAHNNGKIVDNLAFFHIPLWEYRRAWANVIDSGEEMSAGKVVETERGTTTFIYGVMGESDKKKNGVRTYGVFCGVREDNLFEEGLTHGLNGIFCGHDHYNNFSVLYQPAGATRAIRLTYGMSTDYLAYVGIYKEHSQRGCTVISVASDGSFDCEARNYYAYYGVSHEAD